MTAAQLFTGLPRATDANGNVLSGAKWYFYATGTTTPQAVYTDATLGTPLANPVVADSGGLFANIYLNPAQTYRARLTDSLGSVILDIDPVASGIGGTAGASLIGTSDGTNVQAGLDNAAKLAMTARNAFTRNPSGSIPVDTTDLFYGTALNIRETTDTAVSTATPGNQIPTAVNISHYFGGTTINDGRNSLGVHLHMTASTKSDNAYRYYAAGNFIADTAYNDGGVLGTPQGTLYGVGSVSWLKPGATYWRGCISYEGNVCVEATVTAPLVVASFVALPWPAHAVHGSLVDAGLWISSGSSTGFLNGIQIDDSGGNFGVNATGTIMKVTGAGTPTVAQGIDMRGVTIPTGYLIVGDGVISTTGTTDASSTSTGTLRTAGGAGIAKTLYVGGQIIAAKPVRLPVYTAATLPGGNAGDEACVSDATSTTARSVVAGGGANFVKVFHTGANWLIQC